MNEPRSPRFLNSHSSDISLGSSWVVENNIPSMAYRLSSLRYRWKIWAVVVLITCFIGFQLNLQINYHKLLLEQKRWEQRVQLLQEEILSLNKRLMLFTDYRTILERAGRDLGMVFPTQPPDTIWIKGLLSQRETKLW